MGQRSALRILPDRATSPEHTSLDLMRPLLPSPSERHQQFGLLAVPGGRTTPSSSSSSTESYQKMAAGCRMPGILQASVPKPFLPRSLLAVS